MCILGILGVFPYDYDVLTLQNLNFIKFWRHHRISHPQNLVHTNYHAKPSISMQKILYYVLFGEFRGFPGSLWRHDYPEFKLFKILTSPSYFLPQIPCPYRFLCKTHNLLASNSLLCAFWGILGVFPDDYDVITVGNSNF